MAGFSWYSRQRRNHARMRQVNALMIDHYQRYPRPVSWVPAHQRPLGPPFTNQNRSAS